MPLQFVCFLFFGAACIVWSLPGPVCLPCSSVSSASCFSFCTLHFWSPGFIHTSVFVDAFSCLRPIIAFVPLVPIPLFVVGRGCPFVSVRGCYLCCTVCLCCVKLCRQSDCILRWFHFSSVCVMSWMPMKGFTDVSLVHR